MRPPSIPTTIPVNRDDSKQVVIMKSLYNTLIEYREPKTHRILIHVFMCLPPRKEFPDYFSVIDKPMTMNKIRERIEKHQYLDEKACLDDFKLMFSNCKFFNEEGSQIFLDAVFLEKLLLSRREQLLNEYNNKPSRDSKEPTLNGNTITNTSTSTKASSNDSNTPPPAITPKREALSTDDAASAGTPATNSGSSSNNRISTTNTSIANQKPNPTTPSRSGNLNNGVSRQDSVTQQSDSTNQSSTTDQQNNGTDIADSSRVEINHNHHNDTSMDSISNLSADLLASTPVEKCSLNTRRGRNPNAPKRQLLTGYIIYASEIRKDVVEKNPNQDFGYISRLVGNMWKQLPFNIRSKYDQRALIHNKKIRERAQRELTMTPEGRLSNGLHTPKMTKRKLAKLAKEQMRQHHLSNSGHDDSSTSTPRVGQDHSSSMVSQTPGQQTQVQSSAQSAASRQKTLTESSTQTTAFRFVEPPTKKRLVYSETFRKYIEGLQVPNKDLLAEETGPERRVEPPTQWLGAGIGRHESPEAALWALRDFMLQDSVTMRKNMEPYLTFAT